MINNPILVEETYLLEPDFEPVLRIIYPTGISEFFHPISNTWVTSAGDDWDTGRYDDDMIKEEIICEIV